MFTTIFKLLDAAYLLSIFAASVNLNVSYVIYYVLLAINSGLTDMNELHMKWYQNDYVHENFECSYSPMILNYLNKCLVIFFTIHVTIRTQLSVMYIHDQLRICTNARVEKLKVWLESFYWCITHQTWTTFDFTLSSNNTGFMIALLIA